MFVSFFGAGRAPLLAKDTSSHHSGGSYFKVAHGPSLPPRPTAATAAFWGAPAAARSRGDFVRVRRGRRIGIEKNALSLAIATRPEAARIEYRPQPGPARVPHNRPCGTTTFASRLGLKRAWVRSCGGPATKRVETASILVARHAMGNTLTSDVTKATTKWRHRRSDALIF
jgi:hypothetical protein